jgi:DNA-binding response OmpR family regulator
MGVLIRGDSAESGVFQHGRSVLARVEQKVIILFIEGAKRSTIPFCQTAQPVRGDPPVDAARVLLVESVRANGKSFAPALQKHYAVSLAFSGKQGLAMAQQVFPDVIILDAVSMRTSGDRVCRAFRASFPNTPIIHIRPRTNEPEPSDAANVYLYYPFTWRKLLNKVKRFVDIKGKEGEILQVGALRLDVPRRLLIVGDQEKRLTPKLFGLARVFFMHPNTVIARKTLIQQVWNTDYMGDTRTLDVHIRWLREAVEENPSRPRIITTVRGQGYRLVSVPG